MPGQSASQILMVRPTRFSTNPETHSTNHYQAPSGAPEEVLKAALKEFEGLYALYQKHDIDVKVFENTDPDAPDAIFPNSISTFRAGTFGEAGDQRYAILHPMLNPSRRRERSPALIHFITQDLGYKIRHDLSHYERENRALEGTASVVMDHVNKIGYCALSDRTDAEIAREYVALIGYEPVIFRTQDHTGAPVYHTDVLMYVGSGYIGLCTACIVDEDRARVTDKVQRFHKLIDVSAEQLRSFCGNAVEITNRKGHKFLAMSSAAFKLMTPAQVTAIENMGVQIIHTDVSTVERNGGGSVRCMTQELF